VPPPPIVGQGWLTIQRNGTSVGQFNANATGNTSINIEVPAAPTVGNGQLTIQRNGVNLGTFSANQTGNNTINIEAVEDADSLIPTVRINKQWVELDSFFNAGTGINISTNQWGEMTISATGGGGGSGIQTQIISGSQYFNMALNAPLTVRIGSTGVTNNSSAQCALCLPGRAQLTGARTFMVRISTTRGINSTIPVQIRSCAPGVIPSDGDPIVADLGATPTMPNNGQIWSSAPVLGTVNAGQALYVRLSPPQVDTQTCISAEITIV
jgi:hypothetical protein